MTALTQHAPVLEIYQDIANLTSRMLAAANASNWDLVLNHGQEYVCLVERLRELEPGEPLDEAARGMKFDLLVRNVYKVLLTRGLRGVYLHSTDAETQLFLETLVH